MQTRIGRMLVTLAVGLLVVACASVGTAEGQAKRKIAMILPGAIQDADWNAAGYAALREVGKGLDVQVSHSENVAVADTERVAREYIGAGYDVIAFHGGQFPTIAQKLAPHFPKVVFIQETTGRVPNMPANMWTLGMKFHQGYYALGALAALATKTNKVGLIAGVRIPAVVSSTNAVLLAIKEYNPKAELLYNFLGDFNDPVKARQAVEAQLAAGADFFITFVNLGFYGVTEGVKASTKPALITMLYTEKWESAPRHMTVSLVFDFPRLYKDVVGRILKGEHAGYYEMRPGSGIELSEIRHVSPDVAAKVKALFREVAAGKPVQEITDKILTP